MLPFARSLRCLMLLSGLVLMVHTVVPHVHGPNADTGEPELFQKAPADWLDLITSLVGADMGEDHLEHFSPEKTVDFSLDIQITPLTPPIAFLVKQFLFQPGIYTESVGEDSPPAPIIQDVYLRVNGLRGPPVV